MNQNYDNDTIIIFVKSASMLMLFLIILFTGNLPYKSKTFRENKPLLSISQAFSGGLFLSVALLHLLPESQEKYEQSLNFDQNSEKEIFPFPFLITILSFALILFIEKIVTNHKHQHSDHIDVQPSQNVEFIMKSDESVCCSQIGACCNQVESQAQEDLLRKAISSQVKMAQRVGFNEIQKKTKNKKAKSSNLTPYLLQLAVGIHAIFEGLAIGIESNLSRCIGIALAVFCHKWAEGLTLGLTFKKAKVPHSKAKKLIVLQALMNPLGISIGWILSSNRVIIVSIFYAISAGTFLYISTIEVIVEEFNVARYKLLKFLAFLIAIGFISSIWLLEQIDF
ncbi:unnamed protein product [Paramecium primaurelia]|uniref:Zinc/iron permease n=1 Tax=Paramecium primaurelia TaxID=5886 RepID=A0A8S1MAG5_PARPR|nr:unnamed protein product [Paramecium primaurelia]